MPNGYGSHRSYMDWVSADADMRQSAVERALREAFAGFIQVREVEVVVFSDMTALDLASAILSDPVILKPLLAVCNIAARAIERDLGIKGLDTYSPRLDSDQAKVIAGYVKPFLPPYVALPALTQIDRISFVDKEIRKRKGRWEKRILEALNRHSSESFRKRLFYVDGEQYELDAAAPPVGDIRVGIDVKRIEARRDIHKRCDEIVSKASRLKTAFPEAKFGAVVYYPFVDEHVNIQSRMRASQVDQIVFASESEESIENAVVMLLALLEVSAS